MKDKSVSIIIPTFNGLSLLKKNLPAVLPVARKNDEVIIIDDTSTDETVIWLQKNYRLEKTKETTEYTRWQTPANYQKTPCIILILNHHNLRFGATCNRAVELASKDLIFLINNDVVPEANTLEYLMPHFVDDTVFAVGCHEIEANKNGASGGKNRLWFERGMYMHSRAQDFETGETAWASGGSALIDRQKWLELGGFDTRFYPAYWEDVDLSFRARKKGWRILFDANAIVHHNHETTNADVFGQQKMQQISWKNARTFSWIHANLWQKLQYIFWTPYWLLKAG